MNKVTFIEFCKTICRHCYAVNNHLYEYPFQRLYFGLTSQTIRRTPSKEVVLTNGELNEYYRVFKEDRKKEIELGRWWIAKTMKRWIEWKFDDYTLNHDIVLKKFKNEYDKKKIKQTIKYIKNGWMETVPKT